MTVAFAIETVGLTRRYGRTDVVQSIDLRVPAGSIFALVGPNGAGKTTTIKMLMNLVTPTKGSATIAGVDSRRLTSRDFERIAYVSENQQLLEWMTTAELLAYCRPFYPTWDDTLATRLLESFALPADVPLAKLSRGGRMKAALLTALAFHPDVLVLDEPFSGLDPLVRDQLTQTLLSLSTERSSASARGDQGELRRDLAEAEVTGREGGFTVFVSSHDLDEIERLASWIAFIDAGRVLLAESVATLLERFQRADGSRPALREVFLTLASSAPLATADRGGS